MVIQKKIFSGLRQWVLRNAWWLVILGIATGVIMALWGFHEGKDYYFDANNKMTWGDVAYYTLQMIPLYGFGPVNPNIPWQLNVARFWLPFVFFFAAGMSLLHLVGRKGLGIRRHFLNGHVVICGTGEQALELARQYRRKRMPPTVLVIAAQDQFPGLDELRMLGVDILFEDPTTLECWHSARMRHAGAVYLVAENDIDNLQAFETLSAPDALGTSRDLQPLPCLIHIDDVGLRRWLIETLDQHKRPSGLGWVFFSASENCARDLFVFHGPHIKRDVQQALSPPGILILGYNALAEQLILQAAKLGHHPGSLKLQLTLVAPEAHAIQMSLNARFPALDGQSGAHWTDEERSLIPLLDLRCISSLPEGPPAELLSPAQDGAVRYQVCFICVDDPVAAVKVVEMLRAQTCDAANRHPPFRIVLCLPKGSSLLERIALPRRLVQAREISSDNLTVFDPLAYSCRLEENENLVREGSEMDAKAIYSHYVQSEDFDWHALPESERDANRQAADHLKIMGHFLQSDDDQLMRMEHARWCAERLLAGWRYARTKDTAARLNPNLRSYDDLPEVEREKNRSIVNYVRKVVTNSEVC